MGLSCKISQTSAYVYWKPVPGATSYDFRFKLTSSNNWATINTSSTSISLSGLTPGTSYDVGVRARCGTVYSDYTGTYTFVTLGNPEREMHVEIPYGPFVQNITETSAYVYWKPVPGATSYDFRFKLTSSNNWATINTSSTSISLSGLTPGTSYDVGVRARCGTVYSDYTGTYTFVTLGNPERKCMWKFPMGLSCKISQKPVPMYIGNRFPGPLPMISGLN